MDERWLPLVTSDQTWTHEAICEASDVTFSVETRRIEEQALMRLDRWLGFEVKSGWAVLLLFWLPTGMVMPLLYLLVVVFLPLVLMQLYKARWFKWLGVLLVLVSAGILLPRSFVMDVRMVPWVYSAGLFIPFYFYCWVLRWTVSEKVVEIREMEALARMEGGA